MKLFDFLILSLFLMLSGVGLGLLDNTDKTVTWEDSQTFPVSRATCVYDGKLIGIESWHTGISIYNGAGVSRGAFLPYAEKDTESQVFGAEDVGLLAFPSSADKVYFVAHANYTSNTTAFAGFDSKFFFCPNRQIPISFKVRLFWLSIR